MSNHPASKSHILKRHDFDAAIFDLDGVITRTAKVHAAAWKSMFDHYLERRRSCGQPVFAAFDPEEDYRRYVDGKPRYEGVRSFLEARGIDLPYGEPNDPSDRETICGLGNRKNELFKETLRRRSARVYEDAMVLIHRMRAVGFKTAVVTSSKNAQLILETAAITDLFDVRVDGVESAKLGLKGKPEADIFLVAAQHLSVIPARCIVFEDAVAGVQAARQGSFGLVVGVAHDGNDEDLLANGADFVVMSLEQIEVGSSGAETRLDRELPSAFSHLEAIERVLSGKTLAVFLDYDGTLTPIVDRPELALLSAEMREVLKTLAGLCPTAIISGRDLVDVRQMVGLDELYYAGSHGFDIAVPQHTQIEYQEGKAFLPDLTQAAAQLDEALGSIPGCLVERKRFAIAVHYRLVAEQHLDTVSTAVSRIAAQYPRLKRSGGKKIYELRPNLNWDKGKALAWLLKALDLDTPAVLPFYLGDDETDEDAFAAVHERGIGILVAAQPQSSRARYRLADTDEVKSFLKALVSILEKGR